MWINVKFNWFTITNVKCRPALQWTHTYTHTHNTQVCAQQGAQISFHKICCCHGIALHLLTLPWKHKTNAWHGALSEVGQEHWSQVKPNLFVQPSTKCHGGLYMSTPADISTNLVQDLWEPRNPSVHRDAKGMWGEHMFRLHILRSDRSSICPVDPLKITHKLCTHLKSSCVKWRLALERSWHMLSKIIQVKLNLCTNMWRRRWHRNPLIISCNSNWTSLLWAEHD